MRALKLLILLTLLSACTLPLPDVTPTVAPTRTASVTPDQPTPSASLTATPSETPTPTPSASPTATPSETPTPTPSASPTATPSETPTPTPSASPTATPSETPTPTPSASPTATPSETPTPTPSASPTATPSETPTPTPSASPTATPSETPTPTATPTEMPSATIPPSPTPLPIIPSSTPTLAFTPTWTIPPSLTPPPSPSPLPLPGTPILPMRPSATAQPTIAASPVFVTVGAPIATRTELPPPVGGTAVAVTDAPPQPTLPMPPPTALPTIAAIPQIVPSNPLVRGFTLSSGGVVRGGDFTVPFESGITAFARNPVDPAQAALVDPRGVLYLTQNRQPSRLASDPFSVFEPDAPERNNARVVQVAYSPTGRLAMRIDTEADSSTDNDSVNDGIWLVEGGAARPIFRECPPNAPVCIVDRGGGPFVYDARDMSWSPVRGDDALLITLWLGEEGRGAFAVVTPDSPSNRIPDVYRFDHAHWTADGRIVVSGRLLDGTIGFGVVGRDGRVARLTSAASIGLSWVRDAVMLPNERVIMLGAPEGMGAPLRLYDEAGRALTGQIGDAPPVRVTWSGDRRAVLVVTENAAGRRWWVAEVNGAVREITAAVAGALAVEWVE